MFATFAFAGERRRLPFKPPKLEKLLWQTKKDNPSVPTLPLRPAGLVRLYRIVLENLVFLLYYRIFVFEFYLTTAESAKKMIQ